MDRRTSIVLKYLFSLLPLIGAISVKAQYEGTGIDYNSSSNKQAFAVFTNPGEDCSTSMNISWATIPSTWSIIELTDETTGKTFIYDYDPELFGRKEEPGANINWSPSYFPEIYRCETFNNIPTYYKGGKRTTQNLIFNKYGLTLFDLIPDHEYSYHIISVNDQTQQQEISDDYTFHTAGASSWKAAVIGDFHYFSPLEKRIKSAMEMLDVVDSVSGGFDWVLSTGDTAAYGGSFNSWTELSEEFFFRNYMWASVEGNHDYDAANKIKSDNYFRDSHYFPYNGYEGQEGISYWFRYGDVLFLMLNNEAMRQSGGFSPAIEWMESVVRENPSKYVVVVEHYQWLSGTDGGNFMLDRFFGTFDRIGVDLAIAGNNHVYLRTPPLKGRQPVSPEEGTYYVVTPSSDNERGREMKRLVGNANIIEKRWTEGTHTVGAMLMDVNPQRIEMILYDRYGQIRDSFTVPAKR